MSHNAPRIFVINLARDVQRREAMRQRAGAAGLDVEFFDAVDGKVLTLGQLDLYDSKKRLRYFGRDLLSGEIGCLLSHRAIYEKIVHESIPMAVIIEDDVIFEPEIGQVISSLQDTPVRWDVIRFLGSEKIYKRGCRKITRLTGKFYLARLPTTPGGAHGYMIKFEAAKKMLNYMQKNWLPIDALQGRTWETGLETLIVYPAPLYPNEADGSTIGDKRFDKTLQVEGFDRHLFLFNRAYFKFEEALGKKYIYLSSWFRDKLRSFS